MFKVNNKDTRTTLLIIGHYQGSGKRHHNEICATLKSAAVKVHY